MATTTACNFLLIFPLNLIVGNQQRNVNYVTMRYCKHLKCAPVSKCLNRNHTTMRILQWLQLQVVNPLFQCHRNFKWLVREDYLCIFFSLYRIFCNSWKLVQDVCPYHRKKMKQK